MSPGMAARDLLEPRRRDQGAEEVVSSSFELAVIE
jgi:hypothetical protein